MGTITPTCWARPVLHVSHEVFIAPRTIDLEQPSCAGGHSVCVDLRVCFSYIAAPSSYSPIVELGIAKLANCYLKSWLSWTRDAASRCLAKLGWWANSTWRTSRLTSRLDSPCLELWA
ncbi:integrin alpha-6-like isoform X2 [Equus asinus]|uniref:integrin alpha-6-like isoform X2 n=1 Tax=Equus asinus TaxID=9793 RepID=UPI0038F7F5E3